MPTSTKPSVVLDMPERTCLVSRERRQDSELIRFVLSPDHQVVPDLKRKLPGRGVWVTARHSVVQQAASQQVFSRGFKAKCTVRDDLADQVHSGLEKQALDYLPLLRKSGAAIAGFEKVAAAIKSRSCRVLLTAQDASEDGRGKLQRLSAALALDVRHIEIFTSGQLGLAFNRPSVVHASASKSGLTEKLIEAADRLVYYRSSC